MYFGRKWLIILNPGAARAVSRPHDRAPQRHKMRLFLRLQCKIPFARRPLDDLPVPYTRDWIRTEENESMTRSSISLTAFRPEHLAGAVRLSHQAKWPHRLEDWQLAFDLSTGIVAVDTNATTVVGTILMTPYKRDVAT